jgi:cytochrome c peroxidase
MKQENRVARPGRRGAALSARLRTVALTGATVLLAGAAGSASAADTSQVQSIAQRETGYFRFTYPSALKAPLPLQQSIGIPPVMPQMQNYLDSQGLLGIYLSAGPVVPSQNAFFQSLGSNGRSCFTCHQPSNGMSVNTETIQRMFALTGGRDPIFAPVDGSNCPSSVPRTETVVSLLGGIFGGGRQSLRDSHSLLLNKGLFRVFLPVPTTTQDLTAVKGPAPHPVEFTITVVSDPYNCNTDPAYAQSTDATTHETRQMVSVYRRPRMSANLNITTTPALTLGGGGLPNINFVDGTGEAVDDPATGMPISGNIMWDGREPTLESQANHATLGHAQATKAPTPAQVAQMVAFEKNVYAAQSYHMQAGDLTQSATTGAGGPKAMSSAPSTFGPFAMYNAWPTSAAGNATMSQKARASIARGQALFNRRSFTVDNVPGFNNTTLFTNTGPQTTQCASCHGNLPAGSDPFPAGQRDIGIGGQAARFKGPKLATDLPVFKVTCKPGYTTAYYGTEVTTNDPGLALITGKCDDIGRRSVPQLRALSARAPYFSDGSASTLEDVVKVYNTRFGIGLAPTDVTDLANFLESL